MSVKLSKVEHHLVHSLVQVIFLGLCDGNPSVKNSRGLLEAPNRANSYKVMKFLLKEYIRQWDVKMKRMGQGLCKQRISANETDIASKKRISANETELVSGHHWILLVLNCRCSFSLNFKKIGYYAGGLGSIEKLDKAAFVILLFCRSLLLSVIFFPADPRLGEFTAWVFEEIYFEEIYSEEYAKMNVAELKELCKSRGVSATGRKQELIACLEDYDETGPKWRETERPVLIPTFRKRSGPTITQSENATASEFF